MVIDTSAILAILEDEPEAQEFKRRVASAPIVLLSASTYLESSIVVENRRGKAGVRKLKSLISSSRIELVPFDEEQAATAARAYSTYGKGRHRASLNFGDCFSYALAKSSGEPLLFKGDDFSQTDIVASKAD